MKTLTAPKAKAYSLRVWLSGGICGPIWWPAGALCGKPLNKDARGPWGFFDRGDSWRDALCSLLCREGGDFQSAQFTADTVIRFEMTIPSGSPGRWSVRVKELPVAELKDCADLVNAEAYVSDFMGSDD